MSLEPNWEVMRRDAWLVTFGIDDAQTFTKVPFSALRPDDLFTLEAKSVVDPLAGAVAVERMYRALSEPYMSNPIDGEWLIDCERL